jgi:hypothetical protein
MLTSHRCPTSPVDASPIPDLLLQILHCDPAMVDPARLAGLTAEDWTLLTAEAIRHHLGYQLDHWLAADPVRAAQAPAPCRVRLRRANHATVIHNLRQQRSLRKLLLACRAEALPMMLLKGLWQTELVYRELGARVAGDIDLLFRPEDIPRFTRLARTLGYDVPPGVDDLRELVPDNEILLQGEAALDVHWRLTRPPGEAEVDEDKLWRRAETVTLAGMPCLCLGVEDHLLYICFHAAIHHRFTNVGPRALLDVARLIAQPPRRIDWDALVETAQEFGWSRGIWLILDLVRERLGIAPPPAVLQALRPEDGDDLTIRRLAIEAIFLHRPPSTSQSVARLLDEPSLRKRLSILVEMMFPPREHIAHQFCAPPGSARVHWLYLRRWILLLRTRLPTVVRMAARPASHDAEFNQAWLDRWIAAPVKAGLA